MTTGNAALPVPAATDGQSAVAGPSDPSTQPATCGQASSEPVKRKRGRPSRASQGDATDSAVPKKKGRPRKNPLPEPALAPMANSSTLPDPDFESSAGPSTAPIFAIDTAASQPVPMVQSEPSAGRSTAPVFAIDTAASMPAPMVQPAVAAVDATAVSGPAAGPSGEATLFHADGYAERAGRQSTPAEQAYRDAIRSGSVKPMSASPRRVISLSGGGGGPQSSSASQGGTPTRRLPVDMARERAGSMRPRSSLPLFLTPMPSRPPAPEQSEYDEDEVIDLAGLPDDMADDDFEPGQEDEHDALEPEEYEEEEDVPQARITRGSAGSVQHSPAVRTRSRQAPRSSLPSRLVHTPMSTRAAKGMDKGTTRPRAGSLDEPSARTILTRNARARVGAPPSSSQGSTSRVTRGSSAMPTRPLRSGLVANTIARSSRPRNSLPASSQGRSRLIPEIELVRPKAKAVSVSPVKLEPRPRPRPQYVATQTRVVMKPKPKPGPTFKSQPKIKPKPIVKRRTIRVPRVVIPIGKATRARLINAGVYNPFYDDDSDEETTIKRHGHAGLRRIALPRNSAARTSRPSEPEPIPQRFILRGGPALPEPFKSVLDPETITKRANQHECRWKGCAAQMASEWHLVRHCELREHAAQGAFQSGVSLHVECEVIFGIRVY